MAIARNLPEMEKRIQELEALGKTIAERKYLACHETIPVVMPVLHGLL